MGRLARVVLLIAVGLAALASCGRGPDLSSAVAVEAAPRIDPDYASVVIPPNIAPLNFRVLEEGRDCVVRISSDAAPPVEIHCPDRKCCMALKPWRELLGRNKGRHLYYDIFVRQAGGAWTRFARFTNTVAEEPIDPWIAYRQLVPNNQKSNIRGIFQRDLESFETRAVVTMPADDKSVCFNCHSFCQNDPNRFLIHVRGDHPGMIIVADGKVRKINTQQPPLWRPLAYASWHPAGGHIAATLNQFDGYFSSIEKDVAFQFQAVEKRGALVVYNVEKNLINTTPNLVGNTDIETHPCWSADGKYIYYVRCKAQPLRSRRDLDAFRFDLMRVSYDIATDVWGPREMVMEFSKSGKSCSFPRPSPDGRYILHILADRTTYPIHQKSSDLYVLDLRTKLDRKLAAASSDLSESYPRWSSNGRWFSFLSSRHGGLSALPYFAYFDAEGNDHKAVLLPQEDPAFYDTFTDTYNTLELVKSKITISPFTLFQALTQTGEPARVANPPKLDAHTEAPRLAPPQTPRTQ
jgi:hypothetical protein